MEKHMASNAQHNPRNAQASLWVGGLTLEDFEIPSQKSEIAMVASVITKVAFDMAEPVTQPPQDGENVEVLSSAEADNDDALGNIVEQVLAGWGENDNDLDIALRKTLWPLIDSDEYRPSASAEQRIQANIDAIKLMQRLSQDKSKPGAQEMIQLLKYSGWGGSARVFSPDGSTPHALSALRDELKALTSEREFAAMQSSVNTAFYTDPYLVQALWRIVAQLGFEGGRVLEPAAGVGHIIAGMPQAMVAKSELTAVELDPVSASILEANFAPYGLQVHACGLEEAKLPTSFYDLVVTNAPFGKFKTKDVSKAPYADWSIHNYFLGKGLELLRPGGLMVVITTRQSLDSVSDKHRQWISAHADLLGAFRLPTMAFESFANTQAVTDILVFKRRELPDYAAKAAWVEIGGANDAMFKAGETAERHVYNRSVGRSLLQKASINSYYLRNPEHILGKLVWTSGQYGEEALPVFDAGIEELGEALNQLIDKKIPQGVYEARKEGIGEPPVSSMQRYNNSTQAQPGSFVLRNGAICISEGEELIDVDSLYVGTARKRLLGMVEVRDAVKTVIEFQASSQDDAQLAVHQAHLNRVYDAYVAQMGYLSTTANSRVMRGDPSWPLMLALEIWDDEEGKAVKADIFTKRTVGQVELPAKVDTAKDAMLLSLAVYGQIVLKDMAIRTGKPVMEVVKELKEHGTAFRDPVLARWVPADEYLSGNIREKITQAKAAGPAYECNIAALEAVVPADLGPAEVEARLGAPWIPSDVIEAFATELVNAKKSDITVAYDANTATWSVKAQYQLQYVGDHTLQRTKWGTDKRCALQLVEAALNQQPPTVTVLIDGKSVVDPQATLSAREKWQAIRDQFRSWVYQDDARRDKLLRLYNDTFNQVVPRRFDGSHLQLPGMSAVVVPYPHQKDAIWRIVVNGNTLLAHCVGAGKTLTMIAAGMELRRLGKARKPLHVVQGSTLEQYCAEALRLYPQSKVLMATKEDLSGDKRRTFVARVATGDWDAVVMTQSTFERLMLSPAVQREFIESMLREARMSLSLTSDSGAKRSIKEIERRMKDYEAKLERLVENEKADETTVWFDELGVDHLFIDEAHAYKNLQKITKMPRIAGIPNTASQRAFDVYMKTRVIMSARGNKEEGLTMATATPLANSICEMHTFQVYLQPQTLRRYGIFEFDAWAASFGESVTGIELAPDGSGFRTNTRFCRFSNLPELMAIFKGVADVKTKSMLKLPTPTIEGGKPQVMVAEPSAVLKEFIKGLVARADKIRNRGVKPEEDNMLAVTNDGRRAAIDVRMVLPFAPFDPAGKLAKAANNVHRIWQEGMQQRVTQLVFSDLGTPGAPGLSVYEEVKRLLIAKGIPEGEIEFIQDHASDSAKAKLFKRVRDGVVRILFGSTPMLGTGTNVQTRLKAVHQIDAPWRPSDVEQRDGRCDRQGNLCESVELWRYVTEGSFDSYSWNLLDVKAKFIDQVMTAEQGLRTVEDISMTALSYAEIKAIASGNPLVLEKASVDATVQKLSLKMDHYEQDRWKMGRRKADLQHRLKWIEDNMPKAEVVAREAAAITEQTPFKPLLATAAAAMAGEVDNCTAVGLALKAVSGVLRGDVRFGQIGTFALETSVWGGTTDLVLVDQTMGIRARVDRPAMHDRHGVGVATYEGIKAFVEMPAKLREEFGRKTEELAGIQTMLDQGFEFREELEAARKRQREIEAELDLDKAAAGTSAMEAEAA
jgi:N12 class adenine-specific DNA methylase/phospholipid N-methyltransferase